MKSRFNDLTTFLLTFIYTVAVIFAASWQECLFWLVLAILQLSLTGEIKWKYIIYFCGFMVLPAISIFLTSYLHLKNDITGFGITIFGINLDSYRFSLSVYLTIRALSLSLISFSYLTAISYEKLIYSMAQNLKLPVVWAYALMAAFNSTAKLRTELLRIRQAAILRFQKKPAFFFYLIPLLVSAARYSQQTSMSMQARGLNPQKTYIINMKFNTADYIYLLINITSFLIIKLFVL